MNLRILRRDAEDSEMRAAEGCRWLFAERDFWAEETAPVLVTGGTAALRSRFLLHDLAAAVEPPDSVVVVFGPEDAGGILTELGEALRALFPELALPSPEPGDLMRWGAVVDRATRHRRVDGRRRLLAVDGFEAAWKAAPEDRGRFASILGCVARQRSMGVVVAIADERLQDCAALPGFGHACRDPNVVPIRPPRGENRPPMAPWAPAGRAAAFRLAAKSGAARLLGLLTDWRVWAPLAGFAGIFGLWNHLLQPAERQPPLAGSSLDTRSPVAASAAAVEELPDLTPVNGLAEPGEPREQRAKSYR